MEMITGISAPIYLTGDWRGGAPTTPTRRQRHLGVVFSHQRHFPRWPVSRDRATLSQGVHELGKLTVYRWKFIRKLPGEAHGAALFVHRFHRAYRFGERDSSLQPRDGNQPSRLLRGYYERAACGR